VSACKYVITLDTDTQLPRDAARQFVGAMAHPLNRPRYDAAKAAVTGLRHPAAARGDQPAGANRSRYARLYGGEPGIDPYTRAVSDVYQDVFGEGSFIGKGIYDVDAFEQALGGRFPDNRILSHDLLEGCYARSGLLSDVQLYEDYPARYSADVSRRYRWIRGDWQLPAGCCGGCPRRGRARRRAAAEKPALGPVAMEAGRQPAAQSGAGGADPAAGAGLDAAASPLAVDRGGARHPADPPRCAPRS
jgi:cyclic beta-1,2-glucan synthetase